MRGDQPHELELLDEDTEPANDDFDADGPRTELDDFAATIRNPRYFDDKVATGWYRCQALADLLDGALQRHEPSLLDQVIPVPPDQRHPVNRVHFTLTDAPPHTHTRPR